jgi:hypothetical protein
VFYGVVAGSLYRILHKSERPLAVFLAETRAFQSANSGDYPWFWAFSRRKRRTFWLGARTQVLRRCQIALDAAKGCQFLHTHKPCIVHRYSLAMTGIDFKQKMVEITPVFLTLDFKQKMVEITPVFLLLQSETADFFGAVRDLKSPNLLVVFVEIRHLCSKAVEFAPVVLHFRSKV